MACAHTVVSAWPVHSGASPRHHAWVAGGVPWAAVAPHTSPRSCAGRAGGAERAPHPDILHEGLAALHKLPWFLEPGPGAAQGALAALGGREGVVNVAPSLISLAGAVVNVVPGKACKSVKVDPDLIKVRGNPSRAP